MNSDGRDHDPPSPAPRDFQSTRWSMVLAARGGDSAEAREALTALCGVYWYPLYAFVRRKGRDAESAQDIVQGYFAVLLEKGGLASVDRAKGRFRSFLMASCATTWPTSRTTTGPGSAAEGGRRSRSTGRRPMAATGGSQRTT